MVTLMVSICYSKGRLHSSDLLEFQIQYSNFSSFQFQIFLITWFRSLLFIDPKLRQNFSLLLKNVTFVCLLWGLLSLKREKWQKSDKNCKLVTLTSFSRYVIHSGKYHNIPQCSLFVSPKFCISIVFIFSWETKWPQEKLKTMLMQNFWMTNKEVKTPSKHNHKLSRPSMVGIVG